MRCLQCDKEPGMLRKWKNSRFCSTEHEIQYREGIQEGMLNRLRISGERVRRALRALDESREKAAVRAEFRAAVEADAASEPALAGFVLTGLKEIIEPALRNPAPMMQDARLRPELRWPDSAVLANPMEILHPELALGADAPAPCPA